MLPYFTMFQWTICEFPVKKEQFLPTGANHGKKDTAGLQRLLKENTKMADEDSHFTNSRVLGDEARSFRSFEGSRRNRGKTKYSSESGDLKRAQNANKSS